MLSSSLKEFEVYPMRSLTPYHLKWTSLHGTDSTLSNASSLVDGMTLKGIIIEEIQDNPCGIVFNGRWFIHGRHYLKFEVTFVGISCTLPFEVDEPAIFGNKSCYIQ